MVYPKSNPKHTCISTSNDLDVGKNIRHSQTYQGGSLHAPFVDAIMNTTMF